MPKKRPPSRDNPTFRGRMQICADRAGNVNQLAAKSGIGQSTIRTYFKGVEPPRDFLTAIARAANVSVGWLAAGLGPVDPSTDQASPVDEAVLRAFRNKLDFLAKYWVNYETLAGEAGLHPDDLDAIRFNRPPTIFELAAIARKTGTDAREMLGLQHKSTGIDSFKLTPPGKKDISVDDGPSRTFTLEEGLKMHALVHSLLKMFESEPHRCFTQPDDTMESSLLKDDVAIVREQNTITVPDCYLIQSATREFIARAVPTDNAIVLSYDNPHYNRVGEINYNPQKHICIGRVVARLTATKRG